ncbi:unnamed protein product [Linum tenue]|uniref:Uncharacterized protein n=1 Tax=Linum tenue TaxID=586396 RepID=A0AAV0LAN2_9ROSI|nr:unnamed protein product [Linum tenue]CAI0430823.1 unnamed protein product [Linum tenue]CAI0430834.1 unnamed protein product [Linum tenue]
MESRSTANSSLHW